MSGNDAQETLARIGSNGRLAGREPVSVDAGQDVAGIENEEVRQQIAPVEHRMQLPQRHRRGLAEMVEDDHRADDETKRVEPAAASDPRRRRAGQSGRRAAHA